MKTHISFYVLALTTVLSFSGCAASDSGALSDFTESYPLTASLSEQTKLA